MHLLFFKLKVFFCHLKKYFIAIKTEVKCLLHCQGFGGKVIRLRDQCKSMDIGVLLLRLE